MLKDNIGFIVKISFILIMVTAWLTHIFHCLFAAKYLLLIAGVFIAPVGVIHGMGLLFGFSW